MVHESCFDLAVLPIGKSISLWANFMNVETDVMITVVNDAP